MKDFSVFVSVATVEGDDRQVELIISAESRPRAEELALVWKKKEDLKVKRALGGC